MSEIDIGAPSCAMVFLDRIVLVLPNTHHLVLISWVGGRVCSLAFKSGCVRFGGS